MDLTDDMEKVIAELDYTNEGNAQAFIMLYDGQYHFNKQVGWMKWCGTHWKADEAEASAKRAMFNTLKIRRVLVGKFNKDAKDYKRVVGDDPEANKSLNVVKIMQEVSLPFTAFDNAIGYLNVKNGVLDLKTGELTPHNPSQKFTYCLPVAYNKEANQKQWLDFLAGIGLGDEMREYIQKAVGYSMTGETREEIMFYLYGKPRSGKGTFTEVLALVLGELGSGINFRTFTTQRHGDTSNFDLAPLKNKRLLTASESSRFRQLNTAVIKQITGGDEIYCSYKRKDHFSYRPMFVVWLTSNWPINADVDDDAAWGRLKAIEFPMSFLGKEDKGLKHRLKQPKCLEGVLAWAVSGAVAWYSSLPEGLKEPEAVTNTGNKHREELDTVGQFLESMCDVSEKKYTTGKLLFAEYKNWCEDEGHTARRRKGFTQSLEQRGIVSKQKKVAGKNTRVYDGIGLKAAEL
jgi:putative DNA primase/helicase